jgi:hypothetical protein
MSQVLCVCLSVTTSAHACCGFDLPGQQSPPHSSVGATVVATQVITLMTTPRNAARGTDCAPCDGVCLQNVRMDAHLW